MANDYATVVSPVHVGFILDKEGNEARYEGKEAIARGVVENVWQALIGLLIVALISFLFTTVAANAIAIVGSNPVSGMTLMTLIIASLILVAVGLKGNAGMAAALIIGGVVCTALSVAGSFITDLKIGYWIGSTPAKQEGWKFLGVAVSAVTVCGVMLVLNKTYGFTGENALVRILFNLIASLANRNTALFKFNVDKWHTVYQENEIAPSVRKNTCLCGKFRLLGNLVSALSCGDLLSVVYFQGYLLTEVGFVIRIITGN